MDYPIIDWELGTKLAGNNADVAEEMLGLLIKSLPSDLAQIKNAYDAQDNNKLAYYVHRLHGALCYCGAPRLKAATHQLDSALRQNQIDNLSSLYTQFEHDAQELLNSYPKRG